MDCASDYLGLTFTVLDCVLVMVDGCCWILIEFGDLGVQQVNTGPIFATTADLAEFCFGLR